MAESSNDEKPIIVLVDGFSIGQSNVLMVKAYYEHKRFKVVRVPFEWHNILDLNIYAMHVAETIADVAAKNEGRKISVLSYSMGGLATLIAVKKEGVGDLLHKAVSYATPYRGSIFSYAGFPLSWHWPLMRQLRPMSIFLRQLHGKPLPPRPHFVSIGGRGDYICPVPLCKLEGAENVAVFGGHTSFMYRPDIHDKIMEYLM